MYFSLTSVSLGIDFTHRARAERTAVATTAATTTDVTMTSAAVVVGIVIVFIAVDLSSTLHTPKYCWQ